MSPAAIPLLESVETWWHEAKMWTLMYRGGLLAGTCALVAFVGWRIVAARRERERLERLVASRTRQLRQSEELFRSIFEHATEGIFQSSLDGRNLRANPAMAQLCGYDDPAQLQRELVDVDQQFYVQPGRRAEINAAVACDGAAVGWESEIRRRDGTTVWVSESARAVTDPATGETIYQGSIVDITARRETQAAQDRARLAAEAANAAKTAFLTHVTHELRTPLTGILSNARVALRDTGLDDANRARYRLIVNSGEHLLGLIDEVLDLSRIEAGGTVLRSESFSLGELLDTVTAAFQARAHEKRLEFRCGSDASLPDVVRGDAGRLRQVLDNLLGNAFKFTTRGSVMLDARATEVGRVRFEVADTGIGIAADEYAAIFEPFRQVAPPPVVDGTGVGLGLSISRRLVRLMGGELHVESVPGQGSRFFFDLPLPVETGGERARGEVTHHVPKHEGIALPIATPPSAAIQALLTLSLEGDIVRLRARLQEMAMSDPALVEFAREVDNMAAGFRMDAISSYLQRVGEERAGF